jgi:RimJ/RimL family protein N-acetyltransferase
VRRIVLPAEPLSDGLTALRPWSVADVRSLVAACRDPEIARFTRVPEDYTEDDARLYLAQAAAVTAAGTGVGFAIAPSAARAELAGSISLLRVCWAHRRAEVGYWLASGALRLICHWGLTTLGLERIDLLAATVNSASQRVAERAGFTREALLRSYMASPQDGRWDMVAFGLLADELRAPRSAAPVGE